jgi:hypothetical protein
MSFLEQLLKVVWAHNTALFPDLDHHNRCGGDLRGSGSQAGSGPKDPGGN